MPKKEEQENTFIVNDRRKFTLDGDLKEPSATPEPTASESASVVKTETARIVDFPAPRHAPEESVAEPAAAETAAQNEDEYGAVPTPDEVAQSEAAYQATVDRLDTVMRATNPGAEHAPPMNFDRLVQSVYMTAMMQLGAGTQPGEQARVDLMGARQSVDMLTVLADKTKGNLAGEEKKLLDSALFELRMAFLEITQVLARQAAAKQGTSAGVPGGKPGSPFGGPKIVS